ncbi:hypothetical protein VTN96DRAFT_3755 [Rasamsonia emersonii]
MLSVQPPVDIIQHHSSRVMSESYTRRFSVRCQSEAWGHLAVHFHNLTGCFVPSRKKLFSPTACHSERKKKRFLSFSGSIRSTNASDSVLRTRSRDTKGGFFHAATNGSHSP